jgi:predicted MFS family arabinose efflux permease
LLSGLLLGILLARTVAGLLATLGDWRTTYWVASALPYPQLLASIFALFLRHRSLRTRALLGALTFANFSVLWTAMAFLLAAPPYRYSEAMIGMFGLVGAAGALAATRAGRLADSGKSSRTTSVCLLLLLASWLPIWLGQHAISAPVLGIIVLDLAVQAIHVTNQAMLYRMMPEARSRLTAGYMTSYFLGGALGSVLSASAYQHAQWTGVAQVGAALSALNLLVWHLGKVDAEVEAKAAAG